MSPLETDIQERLAPTPAIPQHSKSPVAIEVRNIHKTFRIPTQRIDTLKERAVRGFRRPPDRELHALSGISFDVERGEFFGIVGRNGSGKSTLLKLLASIYRADAGTIRIGGRLAPFLELGVGFNTELTARENVAINAVMMGLTPREARHRFDAILEFAELSDFADLKLKNYSSGMLVRLGFALMTQVDADVLLVDEVLAVGDASFQQRCFDAFARLHAAGRTIILVTHDMHAVEAHCDRAMLLEGGKVAERGDAGDVARRYLEINFTRTAEEGASDERNVGAFSFLNSRILDPDGEPATGVAQGNPISLDVVLAADRTVEDPVFAFHITNADHLLVFAHGAFRVPGVSTLRPGERIRIRATLDNPLASGHYFVHWALGRNFRKPQWVGFRNDAVDFSVYGTKRFGGVVELATEIVGGREEAG